MAERLTPEIAREAVEREGSIQAAARALGENPGTVHYWLDPEASRAKHRAYHAARREADNARKRERYQNLTGPEYNRLLLRIRRNKALRRMAERNRRRES